MIDSSNPLPQASSSGAVLGVLFVLGVVALVGVAGFYYIGFQSKNETIVKEEPVPTPDSFRKSYVAGCELAPQTFMFKDGASLSGDFAACAKGFEREFSATTSAFVASSKRKITVHTILITDKGVTYPVASVYFPFSMPPAPTSTTSTPPTPPAGTEFSFSDIEKSGTVATTASNGSPLSSVTVIQDGRVMVLYTRDRGFFFDQSTLKFTDAK